MELKIIYIFSLKKSTKHMLKYLYLPVAISATIISSLSLFSTAVIAQDQSVCFMVNSSGQVFKLDSLCHQAQKQAVQKSICQGPFDRDYFPIALYPELERLKIAVAKAKQRQADNRKESKEYSARGITEAPEVKSAIAGLVNKVPLFARIYELQQKQMNLYKQPTRSINPESAKKLEEQMTQLRAELNSDPCYLKLMQAFSNKFAAILQPF